MTAINVFLDYRSCHVFADTGHYNPQSKRLNHLASKVFPLAPLAAVLAWSGPSDDGPHLAEILCETKARSLSEMKRLMPTILRRMLMFHPFSAIVIGMENGIPSGFTFEQGGISHDLQPGSFIRSINATSQFDPDDLEPSAIRLMEEQRQLSGVVFGQIEYWQIQRDVVRKRVIHDWNDRPEKIMVPSTLAAKIQNLEVDRINIAPNAVNVLATNTVSGADGANATSQGDGSYPTIINATFNVHYNGMGVSSYGNAQCDLLKPTNFVMATKTVNWSGVGGKDASVKISAIDAFGVPPINYSLRIVANSSGGGGGSNATVTVTSTEIDVISTLK